MLSAANVPSLLIGSSHEQNPPGATADRGIPRRFTHSGLVMVNSTAERCNSALSSLICVTRLSSARLISPNSPESGKPPPSGPGQFRAVLRSRSFKGVRSKSVCGRHPASNLFLLLFIIYFHAQRKQTSSKGVFHWCQNPEISNSKIKQMFVMLKKKLVPH